MFTAKRVIFFLLDDQNLSCSMPSFVVTKHPDVITDIIGKKEHHEAGVGGKSHRNF